MPSIRPSLSYKLLQGIVGGGSARRSIFVPLGTGIIAMTCLLGTAGSSTATPEEKKSLPELSSKEISLLTMPPEESRLAEKVWKEGPQRDYPEIEGHPKRLDSWLALGGMTAAQAGLQSPTALLEKLGREGIHHGACVASEYWMLSQFSIAYWLELRSVNQRQFRDADRASSSIRRAFLTIDTMMCQLADERSYHAEMIWGQSEWLLHQAKPEFLANHGQNREFGQIPLSTLKKELADCRDRSGFPCGSLLRRESQEEGVLIEKAIEAVSRCLESWTPAGKDYLLTEFILVVRDRDRYYYGGPPTPRRIEVLGKRHYQVPETNWIGTQDIGKIMVTLSQGHREIWDASPDCSMPKISWADVSWVKNVKPGDTPANARQSLRVVRKGITSDVHPKGGFILDFGGYVESGASVVSADAQGGVWLERFNLDASEPIARFSLLEPPPNRLPDWAKPFQQRWKSSSP